LTKTIEAGRKAGVISERSVEVVIVDTTVMEKAIAHPTDARLYEKARRRLVTLAQEAGLSLGQSYAQLPPRLFGQVGRYSHARQFKRMRKTLRRLKGYAGRVMRHIQRQLGGIADDSLRQTRRGSPPI
jgi:transposase, IS5 family